MEDLKQDVKVNGYGGCPVLAEIRVDRVGANLALRGSRAGDPGAQAWNSAQGLSLGCGSRRLVEVVWGLLLFLGRIVRPRRRAGEPVHQQSEVL